MVTTDNGRTFDYAPARDPRNGAYGASAILHGRKLPKARHWALKNPVLDQGSEGACVGHGVANCVSGWPNKVSFKNPQAAAFGIYHAAQYVDDVPGQGDGTSVLAGAKVAQDFGFCVGYRWANGIDELTAAVLGIGPVAIGITWRASMYEPAKDGMVPLGGRVVGGHCLAVTGFGPIPDGSNGFTLRNSWGNKWGINGDGYVSRDTMQALLAEGGEACVFVPTMTSAGLGQATPAEMVR